MLTRLDKVVIGFVASMLGGAIAFVAGFEAPALSRCTQVAVDVLGKADPLDLKPSPTLLKAIREENWHPHFPYATAIQTIRSSACMGNGDHSLAWRLQHLPLGLWWSLRFSDEELKGLYVAQAYLGNKARGFAAGARYYFGRELNELSADEERCLAQKLKRPYHAECDGK